MMVDNGQLEMPSSHVLGPHSSVASPQYNAMAYGCILSELSREKESSY